MRYKDAKKQIIRTNPKIRFYYYADIFHQLGRLKFKILDKLRRKQST